MIKRFQSKKNANEFDAVYWPSGAAHTRILDQDKGLALVEESTDLKIVRACTKYESPNKQKHCNVSDIKLYHLYSLLLLKGPFDIPTTTA